MPTLILQESIIFSIIRDCFLRLPNRSRRLKGNAKEDRSPVAYPSLNTSTVICRSSELRFCEAGVCWNCVGSYWVKDEHIVMFRARHLCTFESGSR